MAFFSFKRKGSIHLLWYNTTTICAILFSLQYKPTIQLYNTRLIQENFSWYSRNRIFSC